MYIYNYLYTVLYISSGYGKTKNKKKLKQRFFPIYVYKRRGVCVFARAC